MEEIKAKLGFISETVTKNTETLDKVTDRLTKLEITSVGMARDLKYHIKRTDLLEKQVKPIKTKYDQFKGITKFCASVMALVGLIEGVLRLFF